MIERGKKASVRSAGTGGHGRRNDNSIKVNNPRKVKKRYIYIYIEDHGQQSNRGGLYDGDQ